MYLIPVPSYPPTERTTVQLVTGCPCCALIEGEGSVKKQTLILVMIGVILFIAGSAIAYASVEGASKRGSGTNVQAPVSTSAVVAAIEHKATIKATRSATPSSSR